MIVGDKRSDDDSVLPSFHGWAGRSRSRLSAFLEAKLAHRLTQGGAGYCSPAAFGVFDLSSDPRVRTADVVCLYWINGGFIRPEGLARLTMPVVWRLSDTWPFTGGCHYPGDCGRFSDQCGHCPQLRNPGATDRSRRLWQRKQRAWCDLDLTIVAPSQWIAGLARRSSLFGERPVVVIPTGVDIRQFRPVDRRQARARLGIPQDRPVAMFGALDPEGDARKGFRQLRAALDILGQDASRPPPLAVVFGNQLSSEGGDLPVPAIFLGRLNDDESLAAAYSAADVVVVPSLEDNLPNVALEAIACGTPVVAFRAGGMADIVEHAINGYLASPYDAADLACGINWVVTHPQPDSLRSSSRNIAEARFSVLIQAHAYHELFGRLLADRTHPGGS